MTCHREAVEVVLTAARVLSAIDDLEDVLRRGDRSLSIGAVFHPTEWIANHGKLEEDLELLRKAWPLWRWAKEVLAMRDAEREASTSAKGG